MVERRLSCTDCGNCNIVNLKARIGQLNKALEEALKAQESTIKGVSGSKPKLKPQGPPYCESKSEAGDANLGTNHQEGARKEEVEGAQEKEDFAVEAEGEPLQGQAKSNYPTQAARANYLCLDRPDIGFAVKEAMRRLSCPTEEDEIAFKKIGRYLAERPRMISNFIYGGGVDCLIVEGDSDHAGCIRTRKSTSGGMMRWGSHVLKWWSKTQPTIALSSGEAELTR